MSMIPIPQETFRSAMKAEPSHKPPMNRWAPLGIVITSFVLWGCLYRLALAFAAAMGWL